MTMEIEKLVGEAPDWTGQTWLNRLDLAASALFTHGYITTAQRSKITQKLEGQVSKALEDGSIVERTQTDEG